MDKDKSMNYNDVRHSSRVEGIIDSSWSTPRSIKSDDSLPKILLGVFPLGLSSAPTDGLFFGESVRWGLAGFFLGDEKSY